MRRAWLTAWALFLAGLICIAQQERVSAYWQSRDSNYNVAIASSGSFAYAYQSTNNLGSWNPSTSWSGASFGTSTPVANRWIILYIYSSGPGTITAINANGTITFTQAILDTTNNDMAIWYGNVPTGSTATINFTASAAVFVSNVWLATINGTSQTSPSTTGDYPSASPPGSITITIPTGGIAGAFFSGDGSTPGTYSAPAVSDATGTVQNVGHDSTSGSQTIICNFTSTTHAQGVAFAWGP